MVNHNNLILVAGSDLLDDGLVDGHVSSKRLFGSVEEIVQVDRERDEMKYFSAASVHRKPEPWLSKLFLSVVKIEHGAACQAVACSTQRAVLPPEVRQRPRRTSLLPWTQNSRSLNLLDLTRLASESENSFWVAYRPTYCRLAEDVTLWHSRRCQSCQWLGFSQQNWCMIPS